MDRITAPRRRRPAGTRTTRKPSGQGREAWSRSIRRVPGSGSRGALGAGGGRGSLRRSPLADAAGPPVAARSRRGSSTKAAFVPAIRGSLGLPFPLPGAPVS
ncbi:hypothetical protein PR202_ga02558 [Eleusine coracana subsp. coracana]|uniref:Uncharacterized protein n=1 Tax=Eleusine coracana subsp. coracana TaxID=191504 RepID=A0AAV5BLR4_ELECO|nr:hypothetical protein PR202_ga02558 [Eleusine coracana subsp. coracana]